MDHPSGSTPKPHYSVVYAGGGTFGIAWHLAVTTALRRCGINLDTTPLVGTSAGAWAVAAARTHTDVDAFVEHADIAVPDPRPGALWRVAANVFGPDARVGGAHIAAVELPRMRRRCFPTAEHPVADLIAASSAVPGLFAPHRVAGTWCIDGGVRSMASIDAAAPADVLIVSLPIAGRLFGPVGRSLELTSRRAIARWRATHGGHSIVLRPSRVVAAAVGGDPRALFDTRRAIAVHPLAVDAATARLTERLADIAARRTTHGGHTAVNATTHRKLADQRTLRAA